jgi:hypothetical protein
MLDVLDLIQMKSALAIYIVRLTQTGLEGDICILDAEDEEPHGWVPDDGPGSLYREVRAYHSRRKPRRNADMVYSRSGD